MKHGFYMKNKLFAVGLMGLLAWLNGQGTFPKAAAVDNTLSTAEKAAGWLLLFDGKSTTGWRGYNQTGFPQGWVIEDGTLKSLGTAADASGGDLVYGAENFEEFELVLDWKISLGGNSGIFYHVVEGPKYRAPYETAPEYQLIDDVGFPQKLEDWQKTGADYAMYPAPATKKLNPVGSWNQSRIVYTKKKATYYLNGQKTVSFVPGSADWLAKRNSGKWESFPDYAKASSGLIGLQDHGSFIWFKNIKIRRL